jgi:4,5-DOPA dioxygenase extradiol
LRVVPPIFVAHGPEGAAVSPAYAQELTAWGASLPRPRGVLVVSSGWSERSPTRGSTGRPLTPDDARWSPPGAPDLAHELHQLGSFDRAPPRVLAETAWSPLRCLFPTADVPVLELSLVTGATPTRLYALGRLLGPLARLGYLLVGAGAVTSNVEHMSRLDDAEPLPFARAFDAWAGNALADAEMELLLRFRTTAPEARLANPTTTTLDPLFVVAGAASLYEHAVGFPVRGFAHGTFSRRCVQFGISGSAPPS